MSVRPTGAATPLLTVAAFVVGPLALVAPLGLAPLLTVVAVGLGASAARERRLPVPSADLAGALSVLGALALASTLWAVDPGYSLWRALRFAAEIVEGLLLIDAAARLGPDARRRVLAALTLGLAVMVGLAVLDALLAGGALRWLHGSRPRLSANNRGATVLVLLMWPALVAMLRGRGRAAALGVWALGALGVIACASTSAHLALALASVVFLLAWWRGRVVGRLALVLASAAVLAMPLLPPLMSPAAPPVPSTQMKPSALHRLVIWRFTDARIAERPLLGWGLDASRAIPGGKSLVAMPIGGGQVVAVEQLPLHPHNGPLQLWLELGAAGALVGALVVLVVAARLAAPTLAPDARAAGLAAFSAAALEVSITYGLWQSWWLAALWLAGFFVYLMVRDAEPGL